MGKRLALVAALLASAGLAMSMSTPSLAAPAKVTQHVKVSHDQRIAGQSNYLYFFGNVCNMGLPVQCINEILGGQYNGAPQQFWHYGGNGEPNNDWNVWAAGTVDCTANSFPFYTTNEALLVDCNSFWKGKLVFKFGYAPNGTGSGYCLDAGKMNPAFPTARTQAYTCVPAYSTTKVQYYIYTSSNWLVSVYSVYQSYLAGDFNTYWLGICPGDTIADGQPLCITQVSPIAFIFKSKGI